MNYVTQGEGDALNQNKHKPEEHLSLDNQYGERLNRMIHEIKIVIDMGNRSPIVETYWPGFGAKEYVLFCLAHVDKEWGPWQV